MLLILCFAFLSLLSGGLLGWTFSALAGLGNKKHRLSLLLLLPALAAGLGAVWIYRQTFISSPIVSQAKDVDVNSPATIYRPASRFQFDFGNIRIPGAYRFEPRLPEVNTAAALNYIELGVQAWNKKYRCIGCHVTGTYLLIRPMLTSLGPPSDEVRSFTIEAIRPYLKEGSERLLYFGHRSAQVVYAAAGLASWDQYVTRTLSPETKQVFELMLKIQQEDGAWNVPSCWPPLQSNRYQLATVAALALSLAPGWSDQAEGTAYREKVNQLRRFLKTNHPPHDYARVWLLWAGSRTKDLISQKEKLELIEVIWRHQQEDGGWCLRTFARPGEWGDGSRAEKLVSDQDFYFRTSDGHMTGLALIALREAGVSSLDRRVQRALRWIENNQRVTGRWFSSSLNTERYHMLTYSATCFALLSQWRCSVLSRPNP